MRGESGRVAERVRNLLDEYERRSGDPSVDEVDGGEGAEWGWDNRADQARDGGDGGAQGAIGAAAWAARPDGPGPGRNPDWPDDVTVTGPLVAPPRAGVWTGLVRRLRARVPVRLDPGRRTALAVGAAVVLAAVVTGLWVLAARPRALAVSSTAPSLPAARSPEGTASGPRSELSGPSAPTGSSPAAPGASSPGASASAVVVIDVAGKVRHPGVYRLPAGSRVDDAIRRAGGALAGVRLDSLNLAARLVDGQQVAVGVPPAPGGAGAAPGGDPAGVGSAAASGPVNLNTATLEQLETLPGVGPVLAQHILDWRSQHGRFTSVDQLQDVSGIGPAKFGALKGLVTP